MKKAKYLSLLSIVVVIIVFFAVKTGNKNEPVAETDWGEPCFGMDNSAYIQRISETPSDIEGLSVREKMALGLSEFDGSDSDGDGLTDKEEIEVYGTDPLKPSTSGDFVSDSYKVEHSLDVTRQYDVAEFEDISLDYSRAFPAEVVATASSLTDYYEGQINDVSGIFDEEINSDGRWILYRTYSVSRFTGRFGVRLSDISEDIDENRVVFLMQSGAETPFEPVASTVEDGVLYLEGDYPLGYLVAVAESAELADSVQTGLGLGSNNFGSVIDNAVSELKGDSDTPAIAIYSRFLDDWAWQPGVIYYVSSGDEETDAENLRLYCEGQNALHLSAHTPSLTVSDCKEVSDKKLLSLISAFNSFFLDHNNCPILLANGAPYADSNAYKDSNYFLSYFTHQDVPTSTSQTIRQSAATTVAYIAEGNISDTTGRVSYDAIEQGSYMFYLPFQNFRSYIFTGGNCAGIAYYTAALFNGEDILSSGDIAFTRNDGSTVEYTYDITSYDEDATLLDPMLYDFRDSSFVNDNRDANGLIDYNNLSAADRQFVDMIGTYGAYVNSIPDVNVAGNGVAGSIAVTYQTLINVMEQVDQKKMTILGTVLFDGDYLLDNFGRYDSERAIAEGAQSFSHAINVVGYCTYDEKDYCETDLIVYDSNCPDKFGVFRFFSVNRDPNTVIDWYYRSPSGYAATSWAYDADHYNRFVIFDSQLNDLTSMVRVVANK